MQSTFDTMFASYGETRSKVYAETKMALSMAFREAVGAQTMQRYSGSFVGDAENAPLSPLTASMISVWVLQTFHEFNLTVPAHRQVLSAPEFIDVLVNENGGAVAVQAYYFLSFELNAPGFNAARAVQMLNIPLSQAG